MLFYQAYDQPDIYETNDPPENNQFTDCTQEDEDSIEKVNVSATDAFNKFKDKYVSSKDVDFSDRISSKSKVGYNLCQWEYYSNGENEAPIQKYQRIQHEMQELRDQILTVQRNLKDNEDSKSVTDLVYQIECTGKELDSLNLDSLSETSITYLSNFQEVRFKELASQIEIFKHKNYIESSYPVKDINLQSQGPTKYGTLKYQMTYFPDKAKIQDLARISHLEKRLGYVENIIGISNDNTTKCSQILKSKGITKSIEKLMASACLLNSTQLDILENKVTSLIDKIDKVILKKTSIKQDSKHELIVEELYDLVKKSQNCSEILPQTIDRMLSLNGLHRKAAEFGNQLKDLENLQETINGTLINNKTLLEGIQKNFASNLEVMACDITSLNERIQKLKH
ncbi:PREDICTED: probable dynactin subunit 2 isoform X2 [Ceratosolen solmsi marchali]|uniref:Probable dynactin subunit 2 isoform X2 n=1 Tax=Ceratosolen solmsi marchali TaxID=326594 RepID=A0AAJ6YCZ7_9HYME|nr:PREDICTED: probable dynactin subunit 2 isoform X2 [Ceratosolen solmsi marchali]